jgi:hypothetical protein
MAMNTKLESARRQMVGQQVRTWDVLDARVLETLSRCRANDSSQGPIAAGVRPPIRSVT